MVVILAASKLGGKHQPLYFSGRSRIHHESFSVSGQRQKNFASSLSVIIRIPIGEKNYCMTVATFI